MSNTNVPNYLSKKANYECIYECFTLFRNDSSIHIVIKFYNRKTNLHRHFITRTRRPLRNVPFVENGEQITGTFKVPRNRKVPKM